MIYIFNLPFWANAIITIILSAFIGYITNLIAIKMLFRPYTKKHIGHLPIPFTPGIIPKNRYRLSSGIADMISNDIIDPSILTNNLINNLNLDGTLKEVLDEYNLTDKVLDKKEVIINNISNDIINKFQDSLATKISNEVINSIKPKLGFFAGVADGFTGVIEEKIIEYVNNNSYLLISSFINEKYDTLINNNVNDYKELITDFLNPIMSKLVKKIDLHNAIKDGIDKLDIKEFEHMLIKLIKKELRAITYFGALLGAIIGVIVIFI